MAKPDGRPNIALADFVAPVETGIADFVGAFAVTAGHGLDELVAEFEAANDDYSAILAKALADRLAEAFAERLHERVRRELWGYAPDEALANPDLIAERYQGIRPAPGYPACPDHTEKGTLFELLEAEPRAGIRLTESFAMWPGASVSGYYFWNPASAYFGIGRIGRDQLADYAARKGVPLAEAERWLAPNLADDDDAAAGAAAVPARPPVRRRPPADPPGAGPNVKRGARPRRTSPAHGLGDPKGRSRLCGAVGSAVSVSPVMAPAARAGEPVVPPPRVSDRVPALVQYFRVIANRTGPAPIRPGPRRTRPSKRCRPAPMGWLSSADDDDDRSRPRRPPRRRPRHRPGRHRDPAPDPPPARDRDGPAGDPGRDRRGARRRSGSRVGAGWRSAP